MTTFTLAGRPAAYATALALALLLVPTTPLAAAPAAGPLPVATTRTAALTSVGGASTPALIANWSWRSMLQGTLGNRTRMIQVTLVFVAFGIFILMWGKTK